MNRPDSRCDSFERVRIEQDPLHLYAYSLSARPGPLGERQYELVADSVELIELREPFDIKLPIAEITP